MRSVIIVFISLIFSFSLFSQTDPGVNIDVEALENAVLHPLVKANTEQLDFAPVFFDKGLIFVSSKSDKKTFRNKKLKEAFFALRYTQFDSTGNNLNSVIFDEIPRTETFDGPCSFTDDEQWLFLTRNQNIDPDHNLNNEQNLGIYIFKKIEGKWTYHGKLPVNSARYNVCHPSWDEDKNRLIFASDKSGGFGKLDLYEISRIGVDEWSEAKNLGPGVNSEKNDCFPFIYRSNVLCYSSDRDSGLGGLDIYFAVSDDMGTWTEAGHPKRKINTEYDDLSFIISEDGRDIYFASSRPSGKGKDDLYHISLEDSPVIDKPNYFKIRVLDTKDLKPLELCAVSFTAFDFDTIRKPTVINKNDKILSVNYPINPNTLIVAEPVMSDAKGEVIFAMDGTRYILQIEKKGYQKLQKLIDTAERNKELTVYLQKLNCKYLTLVVADKMTNLTIEDAVFESENELEFQKDDLGQYHLCLSPGKVFSGIFKAKDYMPVEISKPYDSINENEVVLISMNRTMELTNLPTESGEIRILENIFYDYNSAELREEAKAELDKLVKHMKKFGDLSIELGAHTDSRGDELYNQKLSEKRAKIARKYLIDQGIEGHRIAALGYGESRLKNDCADDTPCTGSQHAENRRTEIRVISNSK